MVQPSSGRAEPVTLKIQVPIASTRHVVDQFRFLVGGSDKDPFEHRQVGLAQERLGSLGLQIEGLPGGHFTTNEQPEALAALIAKFQRGPAKTPEHEFVENTHDRYQHPSTRTL